VHAFFRAAGDVGGNAESGPEFAKFAFAHADNLGAPRSARKVRADRSRAPGYWS
jgi:hypothetical protein